MNTKITGQITGLSGNTATLLVERTRVHKLYAKRYKISRRYHVHNPKQLGEVGDVASAVKIRPVSKTKHWLMEKVVKKNEAQV